MPWKSFKQGNKWCVYKLDVNGDKTGPTLGCHASESEANEQVAALNINVKELLRSRSEVREMPQAEFTTMPSANTTPLEPIEGETEELYKDYGFADKANVPYGAKSFDDVRAAREATELAERLEDTTAVFYSLFWNIWNDYEIPMSEKTRAWQTLVDDFFDAFNSEINAEVKAMEDYNEITEPIDGHIVNVRESDLNSSSKRDPIEVDVVIIQPGPGNQKDKHYYPAEMLRRDAAKVFEGAKMYATDHLREEKSVRTEVSKINKIIGYTRNVEGVSDGSPIARVRIWDADFAEDVRNRAKMGELHTLECSILARGKAKKGEIDGQEYNIVTEMIPSKQTNVDWVTSAGAGGRALRLAESDPDKEVTMPEDVKEEKADLEDEKTTAAETDVIISEDDQKNELEQEITEETEENETETAPVENTVEFLSENDVISALAHSNLPKIAKERVATGSYASETELQNAITNEVEYVKLLSGSGQPTNLGETSRVETLVDAEQIEEKHSERIKQIFTNAGILTE